MENCLRSEETKQAVIGFINPQIGQTKCTSLFTQLFNLCITQFNNYIYAQIHYLFSHSIAYYATDLYIRYLCSHVRTASSGRSSLYKL